MSGYAMFDLFVRCVFNLACGRFMARLQQQDEQADSLFWRQGAAQCGGVSGQVCDDVWHGWRPVSAASLAAWQIAKGMQGNWRAEHLLRPKQVQP